MGKKAIATCLLICICVVFLFACGDKVSSADTADTDGTTAPLPHDTILPPDTETVTDTTVYDPELLTPDTDLPAQKQAICDAKVEELVSYIKGNTPEYKREITSEETSDETADTEPVFEEYIPEVSFYYMDLESGATMSYNGDRVSYCASLIKQPFVLWALKTIEAEETKEDFEIGSTFDVNRIFTYEEKNFREGSGIIQNSEYGTEYTYLDLLKLTITKSDNIAFYELRKSYGTKAFYAYCESLGVKSPQKSLYNLSVAECAIFLRETYEYFESGSKYAELLKQWMQGTNHRIMIPHAVKSPVANKYGWDLGAYHDMGVVFHEHPYIVVVMTELENGSSADNKFIRNLIKQIEAVHEEINSIR